MFTTRPEHRGTFGMGSSTRWLASQTGMAILERGANAFDAAVAAFPSRVQPFSRKCRDLQAAYPQATPLSCSLNHES